MESMASESLMKHIVLLSPLHVFFSLNHSNKSAEQPVKDNDSLVFGCSLEELRSWLHGEGRLQDTIGGGDKAHLRGSK